MTIMREHDYGTPAKVGSETITVSVDGHDVCVPAGTSVLRAASEAGIPIPKLCATDSLAPPRVSPAWWCTPLHPNSIGCGGG